MELFKELIFDNIIFVNTLKGVLRKSEVGGGRFLIVDLEVDLMAITNFNIYCGLKYVYSLHDIITQMRE